MWVNSKYQIMIWFTHLDTEEQSNKKDWNGEEEEEHEEPGTPVEPVAETHHPHVLLHKKSKGKQTVFVHTATGFDNIFLIETQRHTLSFFSFSCTTARTMLRDV